MTPMIDVVFQLLIFFVVVLKQDDILSKLDAHRPMPPIQDIDRIEAVTIAVGAQGFTFNGEATRVDDLDRHLGRVSVFGKNTGILVKCTRDSQHGLLIQALDLCSKHGLTKISVLSM
jgi:biopolymer transport protein ExbD